MAELCYGCFDAPRTTHCAQCDYIPPAPSNLFLNPGVVLRDRFIVGKILGTPGGFGVTYLAWDTGLRIRVAIKEFFPRDIVSRIHGGATVQSHSQDANELFAEGLQGFTQEAQVLAKFNHPNIVHVTDVFSENGTAYIIMEYCEGDTLKDYAQKRGKIREGEIIALMKGVLEGLNEVHAAGFLHRDIKPHNIIIRKSNQKAVLIDFGTARLSYGEQTKSLSVMLTPGFAPMEQYQKRGRQGAWTDLYACGATMYYLATGEVPLPSPDRTDGTPVDPPHQLTPGLSTNFSNAIMYALDMDSKRRPQSVDEFTKSLEGHILPPSDPVQIPAPPARPTPQSIPSNQPSGLGTFFAGCTSSIILFFIGVATTNIYSDSLSGWMMLFYISVYLTSSFVCYKIGQKFGIGTYGEYLIPIYNTVLLCRCAGISGWAAIFCYIPVIQWFFPFFLFGSIAKRLGREYVAHGLGCYLGIPILVLAFGSAMPVDEAATTVAARPSQQPAMPQAPPQISYETRSKRSFSLKCIDGEYRGNDFVLPDVGMVLGRSSQHANLVLTSDLVSRSHARLVPNSDGNGVWIEDMGSTQGTFYSVHQNGQGRWEPVKGRIQLMPGQSFCIGNGVAVFTVV